jgi:hypothetical protein
MSADNPLTFIASSTSISPSKEFMHGISRQVRSKCWISIDRLASPAPTNIIDFMLERYNKPNRQMTNVVKAAIAEAYNDTVSDRDMVEGRMEKLTAKDIKLEWDQYCGCSCPCSPGYRVSFNDALFIRPEVKYNADIVVYLRPSLTADEPQPKTAEAAEHEMNIAVLIDTLSRGGRPVKIQITKPFQVIKK